MSKIILIGNYPSDRQESMIRFANMLSKGFMLAGYETEIWQPKSFFGAWSASTSAGFGKWLGYIDKWLIFPLILRKRLLNSDMKTARFHVCDHSNAPYLNHLPSSRTSITCHDVLAIRGAFGYADAYCPASGMGKILQKWILKHLSRAKLLATVSKMTLTQLNELSTDKNNTAEKKWRVIYNGFNNDFAVLSKPAADALLQNTKLVPGTPFILHVGSALARKNRRLLIDMISISGNKWNGLICFAGEAIEEELMEYIKKNNLQDRVVSVEKPNHQALLALYSTCDAFIFPSFSEGFGWPVIEAQACGAPVIASTIEPMQEVSGGAALHADPAKPEDFAKAFLRLKDNGVREDLVQRGYQNALRFDPAAMTDAYLDLHDLKRIKT